YVSLFFYFFFSSRRRHTRFSRDWSSDVCSSDLVDGRHQVQQLGKVGDAAVAILAPVAVDVLPQQGDFLHAVLGQVDDLAQHVIRSEERRVGKACRTREVM